MNWTNYDEEKKEKIKKETHETHRSFNYYWYYRNLNNKKFNAKRKSLVMIRVGHTYYSKITSDSFNFDNKYSIFCPLLMIFFLLLYLYHQEIFDNINNIIIKILFIYLFFSLLMIIYAIHFIIFLKYHFSNKNKLEFHVLQPRYIQIIHYYFLSVILHKIIIKRW
jgi:hypothetical protein